MARSRRLVFGIAALVILVSQVDVSAQESTTASSNGSWTTGSNWSDGSAPGVTNLSGTNITINSTSPKYIRVGNYGANQNLTFAANSDAQSITINGTLVVYGNVDFANKAMNLVIPAGGVMIILGDLDMNNKIDLSLGGILVVKGDFGKTGSQGSFTGTGGVYAGTYSGDASNLIPNQYEHAVNPDLINDPSLQYIEDFLNSNGANPLPIELLFFKAKQTNDTQLLEWATATERNFDFFSVQHSVDGVNFKEIEQVKGHGTSKERIDYSFENRNPLLGKNYYRLKSVDFDGSSEYSRVVLVEQVGEKTFVVAPNPSSGTSISLIMNFVPEQNTHVTIFDNSGMVVGVYEPIDSFHSIAFQNTLKSGLYFARFVSRNYVKVERFVVR